ncbi:MAG: glycosyltransferase family 10 [Candidatus Paceibacterota bacterium]
MIRIKLTTANPHIPLIRQTPESKGIFNNCQFFVDKDIPECDFWVVVDGMQKKETVRCPKENTILIAQECEFIKKYDQKFLDQFSTVITCQKSLKHKNAIQTQTAFQWMIGHMGSLSGVDPKDFSKHFIPYEKLKAIKKFDKTKLISVFSSGKNRSEGQQKRLNFIDALKKHFGSKLDVFGVNEIFVKDKWDGIAPYKYHITLENASADNYWTEKIADAFLAGAYPIYYGAPNILDYFPKDSLTQIDINDPQKSIATIEKVIANDLYEKNQAAMTEARNLALDKHNIFAMLSEICNKLEYKNKEYKKNTLKPENKKLFWVKFRSSISKALNKTPKIQSFFKNIYTFFKK